MGHSQREATPGQELGAGGVLTQAGREGAPLIGWPRFPIASVRLRRLQGVQRVCNAWGPVSLLGALHVLNLCEAQCLQDEGSHITSVWWSRCKEQPRWERALSVG